MIGSFSSILIGSHKKSFISHVSSLKNIPKSMEFHTQYHTAQTAETQLNTSIFDESDKMFKLIHGNRTKDLLEFFQSLPRDRLYNLVNNPNEKYNKTLPINFAIRCSSSHLIFIMLLRLGARFDFVSTSTTPLPLFTAVRSGQMNLVKILIVSGADINALDEEGFSILHWACFKKNTLMIRLILKLTDFTFHNHDRNTKRITPLGISIKKKYVFNLLIIFFVFRYSCGV